MTEGMDPALAQMPGWDPLTRLDWESLGAAASRSIGSPADAGGRRGRARAVPGSRAGVQPQHPRDP